MKEVNQCIICGSSNLKKVLVCEDYLITNEKFKILRCSECGFKITSPQPNKTQLPSYYQSDQYISHSIKIKGLTAALFQWVRKFMVKKKYNWVKKYFTHGSMLDIGCGTGDVIRFFNLQKWKVAGVEPIDSARKIALDKKLFVTKSIDDKELLNSSFDVISLWHVFEHLSNPVKYLNFIRSHLQEKGILIIALPNPDSFDAKYYNRFWGAYDVPRHLHHFTSENIQQLLKQYGFYLIKELPMRFDAYYVSLLSEKNRTGKEKYLKSFFNGFRSNFMARVNDNNYSSKVYIFKKYINV